MITTSAVRLTATEWGMLCGILDVVISKRLVSPETIPDLRKLLHKIETRGQENIRVESSDN